MSFANYDYFVKQFLLLVFLAQKAKNVVVLEVDKVFTFPGSGDAGVSLRRQLRTDVHCVLRIAATRA